LSQLYIAGTQRAGVVGRLAFDHRKRQLARLNVDERRHHDANVLDDGDLSEHFIADTMPASVCSDAGKCYSWLEQPAILSDNFVE
jgi:hypothetical protein